MIIIINPKKTRKTESILTLYINDINLTCDLAANRNYHKDGSFSVTHHTKDSVSHALKFNY